MLDFKVAEAFEVKTGALNQAVTRNKKKFSKVHAFRLTRKEAEDLRSQGVIPKRTGRGGTTKPPMAYTQKGVARLATVLTSPKALAATDLMIDVFTEIYTQVAHGIQAPTISNPGRLADTSFLGEQVQKLKLKLLDHLGALMDLPMPGEKGSTLRDTLSENANLILKDVRARLERKSVENDKIVAETLLLLEEVKSKQQERMDKAERSKAETEKIQLENIRQRIGIVRETLDMMKSFEPSALISLYQGFNGPAVAALPNPDAQDLAKITRN